MPNSAISFNTAGLASATSPGLVGTGAQTFAGKKTLDGGALIKGDTSGAAIAASYVGQVITGSLGANPSFTTTSYTDLTGATLALTAGVWSIVLETPLLLRLASLTGGSRIVQNLAITKNDNTILSSRDVHAVETGQTPLARLSSGSLSCVLSIAVSDTLKLRGRVSAWSGTETFSVAESIIYTTQGARFEAVRIA